MARPMKDSGVQWIGSIPSEWTIERNKNLFRCSKEIVGTESANIQLLSLTTRGVKKKSIDDVGGKIPESYDTYQIVSENNLIMCLFDLDCSAVFSGLSPYNGMISPAYKVLSCTSIASPSFYNYWFMYVADGRKFNHYAKNLRFTLNYDEFATLPAICPSVKEQQSIANFLDDKCAAIDDVVTKTQESIEEYKKLKQAVITEAVTKGVRGKRPMKNSGIEWIGQIPKEWIRTKMNRVCSFHNGDRSKNYPSPDDFIDEGIPFIGADSLNGFEVDNIIAKHISVQKYNTMGGLKIHKYDILYTLRGSTIGKNAMAMFDDGTVASSLMGIRVKNSLVLLPRFLMFWLQSEHEYIQRDMCINGSTAPNLSAEDVAAFIAYLPFIDEQKEIADYLDKKCAAIDSLIEKKQQFIEELTAYKKSLIYEYVTGKKEVPA